MLAVARAKSRPQRLTSIVRSCKGGLSWWFSYVRVRTMHRHTGVPEDRKFIEALVRGLIAADDSTSQESCPVKLQPCGGLTLRRTRTE